MSYPSFKGLLGDLGNYAPGIWSSSKLTVLDHITISFRSLFSMRISYHRAYCNNINASFLSFSLLMEASPRLTYVKQVSALRKLLVSTESIQQFPDLLRKS